jgi:hypothetical protein
MITRIIKVTSNDNTWYEVQIKVLGLIWVDADIVNPNFKTVYSTFDEAMSSLDKLKPKRKTKTVVCKVKI